ncbi:WD40 repeat domain-containing protein [uncultured Gimesia sp.]|uniref:WD40 repeat domain-containing protein n=1 Tax=uncultured Gimesia sp. TaxID=1678688 RepID=UPI0030DA669F|tara:strand:- start:9693 stop:10766 length:1074 start_codon:yes stop_codon:yes gene_type:complete
MSAKPKKTTEVLVAPKPNSAYYAIDPTKTHEVAQFKHQFPLTSCRVDPTGRYVVAGAQDLEIQVWDLATKTQRTLKGHTSWVRSFDFSAAGNTLFSACWGGDIKVWNMAEAEPKPTMTIPAHQGSARWVRVSPDQTKLVTCGNDLLVKVWKIEDGSLLHTFAGHDRHVYAADFHPDGQHLVSQDLMGVMKVWDMQADKEVRSIDASVMTGYDKKFAADMGGARDLQFSPDGSELASAGITKVVNSFAGIQDPIIMLFDWKTGKETAQLKPDKEFQGIAWGVRFHPDGFLIGAGADRSGKGELWFRKPGEAEFFHTMKLPKAARGLDLFSDGHHLVIAHADGTARVYRMSAAAEKVKV